MLGTLYTRRVRRLVTKRLPVLNWLPYYKPSIAVADLVAGVTVGLTLIPQAIAYASLAGLHAQVMVLQHDMWPFGLPHGKPACRGKADVLTLLRHNSIKWNPQTKMIN
jgi:hypothetical protein